MPLLKCQSSKSTPQKVMAYVTDKNKAEFVSVRNLFEDEDYAEQFEETAKRFGKGEKFEERKYYHFKLSCDRKDKVSPQEAHIYAEELTAILFRDCECVIATHTDTDTVHSHIVVNAVHPVTGKKLRISRKDYTDMKDEANRLGKEMGFSEIDFRKKAKNNRTAEEQHIILKGGTSWKEELREVIEEAKQTALSEEEFITHLSLYGVTLNRTKTEYSYLHPKKKKPIRGAKLGENYTKKEILNGINKNRYGGTSNSVIGNRETYGCVQGYDGQPATSRSIGEIERELQRLNQESEYARQGLDGRSEIAKREQRIRDEKNDSISNGDGGRTSGSSEGGTSVQDGNKSNYKKRDYSFSK